MRKQYLHLSAYPCDTCAGPVISGSLGIRENEISKETEIRQVGAMCLSCGRKQDQASEPARARHLPPIEWGLDATDSRRLIVFVQAANGVEATLKDSLQAKSLPPVNEGDRCGDYK